MATTTEPRDAAGWRFDNMYTRLPTALFTPAQPAAFPAPRVAVLNHRFAAELGLTLAEPDAAAVFAGQAIPAGAQPIAQAYAGHQFGHFTMLGDGRAILLGEHRTPDGRLVDIQLKGGGRTRFSRGGDGKAALGPMLREYLVSEAMAALGVPTTRSLAVVTTGEPVYRTTPQPGAVLTRVAASHLRVGTFEYAAGIGDESVLRALADYAIQRHYPELADAAHKYREFFRAVLDRQAGLIARWQLVGFIHGVMNTDNMAISGETIDYGPCAFMNAYRAGTVFSSIDHAGRYRYENQPGIAQWNLARLAEALLPLLGDTEEAAAAIATEALHEFPARFRDYWLAGVRQKLGLQTAEDGDGELAEALFAWMEQAGADFTNTFRDLSAETMPTGEKYDTDAFRAWFTRWRERLGREGRPVADVAAAMRAVNPAVIPRNHRVEEALTAAEGGDLAPFLRLLAAVTTPFDDGPAAADFRDPHADETGYRTFCGT